MISSGTNAFTATTNASSAVPILTTVVGYNTLSIFNAGTNSGFFSLNGNTGPWCYLPAGTATVPASRIITITTAPNAVVYITGGSGNLAGVYADAV